MASTAAETSQNASAPAADGSAQETPIVTPSNFPSHVTVKFTTSTYPDKVAEAPFKVPSDLTRFGLSEVVNTLLKTSPPVPFEFLTTIKSPSGEMKKVFLRSSLKKFFIKIQQYPESVITLEYIEAYPAPKQVDTIPHDDWVSAIAVIDDLIVTGCYDGLCRIISNETGAVLASVSHQKSSGGVKSVSISREPTTSEASSSTANTYYILTCTNDEHARLWKFDRKSKSCSFVAPLKAHAQPVNAVQFNHKGNMAITASADKTIKLWDVFSTNDVSNKESEDKQPGAKKQKVGEKYQPSPIGTLSGHVLPVTCMHWHSTPSESILATGSQDHTIRLWDVSKGQSTCTLQGSKVVSALSYNPSKNLVLSGHPDFLIRMWDARAQTNRASLFRSHKGWVRGVEWLGDSEYEFASGGDDNLIKIWDTRAGSVPVHSIPHHVLKEGEKQTEEFKVLCIKTNKPKQLLSGSSDCTLKKHSFTE